MRDLSRSYWLDIASGEVGAELGEIGRAATASGRARRPPCGQSSFGATGRQTERNEQKQLREAFQQLGASGDLETATLATSQHLRVMGATVKACLTMARAVLRPLSGGVSRAETQRRRGAIVAFQGQEGAANLRWLQHHVPDAAQHQLAALPSPPGTCCFELATTTGREATDAASLAARQGTQLGPHLKQHWQAQHNTIMDDDCTDPPGAPVVAKNKCYDYGRCICSAEGKAVRALLNGMMNKAMKPVFHRSNVEERKLLREGNIVVRLWAEYAEGDISIDALLEMDDSEMEIWGHIGLMYLSPYRPTFTKVVPVPAPDSEETEGRVYVKVIRIRRCLNPVPGVHPSKLVQELQVPTRARLSAREGAPTRLMHNWHWSV